ncbi:hypothetical protein QT972_34205 [Microcoleus sp. herbarium7]|uniref:hypothetical protein n=1 Tax=Microcoleus sp. herbarium13 TaxID=3055438 RepID=UPI002FD007AB
MSSISCGLIELALLRCGASDQKNLILVKDLSWRTLQQFFDRQIWQNLNSFAIRR